MFTKEMRKELSRKPVNTRSKAKHNTYMEGKEMNMLENEKNMKHEQKEGKQIDSNPLKGDKSAESTVHISKSVKQHDTRKRNSKLERKRKKKSNKDSSEACVHPVDKKHNISLATSVNEEKLSGSCTPCTIRKNIRMSSKKIMKDESVPDTASISIVTPQSSPIMINPSPHRSVKTPKKSPVSLASPKARSVAPMRVSKTPRKLNLAVKTAEVGWNDTPTWYKTLHNTPVKRKKKSTSFTDITRSVRKFSKSPKIVLRSPKSKLKASKLMKSRMSAGTLMSSTKGIKQRKSIAKQNTSTINTKKSLSKSLSASTNHEMLQRAEETSNKPVVVLDRLPMLDRLALLSNTNKNTIRLRVLAKKEGDNLLNCTQLTPKSTYYAKRVPEVLISSATLDNTAENSMDKKKPLLADCVVMIPDMGDLTIPLMSSTPMDRNKGTFKHNTSLPDATNTHSASKLVEISSTKSNLDSDHQVSLDAATLQTCELNDTYCVDQPKTPECRKLDRKRAISTKNLDDRKAVKKSGKVQFVTPSPNINMTMNATVQENTRKIQICTPYHESKKARNVSPINKVKQFEHVHTKSRIPKPVRNKFSISKNNNIRPAKPNPNHNLLNSTEKSFKMSVKATDLKSPAARKMPNFSEIHKKMFAKSESLTDAKKRIQARHVSMFGPKVCLTPVKSNSTTPLLKEKNGSFNRFGYKIRMKDAINIVSKKQPYNLRMKRQEENRQILKGVRTNRRFELQMKSRNIKI